MSKIIFGSLFAGIGGFDLGLERAGMIPAWQVEIDPFCRKVLQKHWPNVERFSDVRECGKHNLEPVDLICGGFPCQPHSLAGKRQGAADDRDLWPEYCRIISELRPRWIIAENVPGIRTTILDQVLSDMKSLDYAHRTLIIPACAFDAPHRRDRVFIIAHTNRERRGQRRLSECENNDAKQGRKNAVCNTESGGCDRQPRMRAAPEFEDRYSQLESELTTNTQEPGLSNGRQTGRQAGTNEANGRMAQPRPERYSRSWWTVEPGVGRVAARISNRVDRLRALGNAVVPQIVEWIGRIIVEVDQSL